MKPAAFYEQEAAVCSFTSALSNAEIHYSLSISAPPSPSLSLPSPQRATWSGYYTFASELHFLLGFV